MIHIMLELPLPANMFFNQELFYIFKMIKKGIINIKNSIDGRSLLL